ncbi:MAG: hypothetical protein AB9856_05200 [Cellulosilyticaceae bacterium]
MVKQDRQYVENKKKSFLKKTILWGSSVILIFGLSWYFTGKRANYFSLIAAALVIPLALNMTRYISFRRFKDPKVEEAKILDHMKGSYALYHSAIIPDTRETVYFSHLIITSRSIFLLTDCKETLQKSKNWVTERLNAKGFELKSIHFIETSGVKSIKNAALKIEKDACYTSQELDNRTAIIEAMLL